MQFERTRNPGIIKAIATHPRIYPAISDDFSPSADEFQPIEDEAIYYLLAKRDRELLGMFCFLPENGICWKVHTCLLPTAYGPKARDAGKQVIQWIWANTPCVRIITDVPDYNRLALNFALDCGLKAYGINAASYMKNGKLWDQIVLGVSKPCH